MQNRDGPQDLRLWKYMETQSVSKLNPEQSESQLSGHRKTYDREKALCYHLVLITVFFKGFGLGVKK